MKKVLIAVPTDAFIHSETFKSIYHQKIPEGVECYFEFIKGNDIDTLRNKIVERTLEGFDYLFSVDSDIILPLDALDKLFSHGLDMVAGVYIQRNDKNLTELYERLPNGAQKNISSDSLREGLLEVSATGFGCVLIAKKVFESMTPPYFYYSAQQDFTKSVSEDVFFCNKLSSTKIYADTSVLCKHIGEKVFEIKPSTKPSLKGKLVDPNKEDYTKLTNQQDRIKHLYSLYPERSIPHGHMQTLEKELPKFFDTSKSFVTYDIGSELLYWSRDFSKLFPSSEIYHFEGNPELEPLYKEVGLYNYHVGILAETEKEVCIDSNNETGSLTIFEENKSYGQEAYTSFSKINTTAKPLWKVVEDKGFKYPDVIKLDIQGAELEVLRGSEDIVKKAKVVIAELQHTDYILGAPLADEVIEYMESIGFENLGEFYRNGVDGDYLFVNNNK